ncbi:hypothetical protein KAR91_00900 [Candidatus Pacearchaeota archaeon]|nr:hypothetical protein [Candidatus Pacearchaeota archaeon]
MSDKTIPDARKEAEKIENEISKLISGYQNTFGVTVTEVVLDPTYTAGLNNPARTSVAIGVKLK